MDDALNLIKERLAKAEAKVSRAKKAWESAENEVSDLRTTYRVMRELSGESPPSGSPASTGDRQKAILRLLPIGHDDSVAPADLFEAYKVAADEELSIDTFRTTLWRMKDTHPSDEFGTWTVHGESGRYWKTPSSWAARELAADHQQAKDAAASDYDFDDDPPF